MATLATIVAVAALIGAIASWIAGAVFFVRTHALSSERNGKQMLFAAVAWPFASRRMTGDAALHSAKVNKALVAFFTCLMIAAAATSLATNLSRLSR
jgi:fucose 4-O-acetylase-like acetyltransferase